MSPKPNVPEAWQIAEIEKLRRDRNAGWGEPAAIPLPLPLPPPPRAPARESSDDDRPGSTVIVIDLW